MQSYATHATLCNPPQTPDACAVCNFERMATVESNREKNTRLRTEFIKIVLF